MKYTKIQLNHGYANHILTIDLGKNAIAIKPLDPQMRDFFIVEKKVVRLEF